MKEECRSDEKSFCRRLVLPKEEFQNSRKIRKNDSVFTSKHTVATSIAKFTLVREKHTKRDKREFLLSPFSSLLPLHLSLPLFFFLLFSIFCYTFSSCGWSAKKEKEKRERHPENGGKKKHERKRVL